MDHVLTHAKQTSGEALRLSRLEAFVAWVVRLIETITGMKRRKVFPTSWKDHWQDLRQLEWLQHQLLAFCTEHVLAGRSLSQHADFPLIMDVPDGYGRPCPSTPEAMNRRFILQQRFRLDPNKYILRHLRRIARREHVELHLDAGGCPLRLAARAASPSLRLEEDSNTRACLSASNAQHWGRWHAKHDGGGSRDSRGFAQARAPPYGRLPTPHSSLPQMLRA